VKLLTDLQIWGCELHKNAFGGAGGAITLPRPLTIIRVGEGGKGNERVENREGRKGREGKNVKNGKGKEGGMERGRG